MQARIFILGFVQGVGFRAYVRKNARDLSLKGYVKNLPDQRVEVLVQGSKEDIQKLIVICEKGTFFSEIKSVQVEWEEIEEKFTVFEILH
jgi:acylphosphatase